MSSGLRHELAQGCHVVPTVLCTGLLLVTWHLMAPRLVHRPMRLVFVSEATANHGEDIATFMIRNAYHFSTLYHAARAEQWALAAYEAEELEETLEDAARASPTYRLPCTWVFSQHPCATKYWDCRSATEAGVYRNVGFWLNADLIPFF
jgi:hypothetical protein